MIKLNWNKWHDIQVPDPPRTGNCRYCKHTEWSHRFDEKGRRPCNEGRNMCKPVSFDSVNIIVPNDYKSDICSCMSYVPGDNLAYLEWKEKRGY